MQTLLISLGTTALTSTGMAQSGIIDIAGAIVFICVAVVAVLLYRRSSGTSGDPVEQRDAVPANAQDDARMARHRAKLALAGVTDVPELQREVTTLTEQMDVLIERLNQDPNTDVLEIDERQHDRNLLVTQLHNARWEAGAAHRSLASVATANNDLGGPDDDLTVEQYRAIEREYNDVIALARRAIVTRLDLEAACVVVRKKYGIR